MSWDDEDGRDTYKNILDMSRLFTRREVLEKVKEGDDVWVKFNDYPITKCKFIGETKDKSDAMVEFTLNGKLEKRAVYWTSIMTLEEYQKPKEQKKPGKKTLRPCDCKDMAMVEQLEEAGIGFNDESIVVKPNYVEITVGPAILKISMLKFQRFAEWYLQEQEIENK